MSWISNQLSSIGEFGKKQITKPLAGAYNRNKSAILDAAAMAALAAAGGGGAAAMMGGNVAGAAALGGAGGFLGGTITGAGQDAQRHDVQRQVNNKAGAAAELGNLIDDIGGPPTGVGYPGGSPTDSRLVVMDPVRGRPIPITDPAAKDLISGGQVPIDPTTGQPVMSPSQPPSGVGGTLTDAKPVDVGVTPTGSTPIGNTSSDITYTFGQQDPNLNARIGQILGTGNTEAEKSAGQVANANDLATQLSQQTLDQQAAARKQQIADMSTLLTNQAKTQYERSLPSLYEDLNTRGLLRSSDLGNQMATKEQQSYQDVANQLAQQQLGYNDQYINGLGNITSSYNAGVGSALQREQSLQDYASQVQASLKLGQAVTPVASSGKSGMSTATNAIGLTSAVGNLGNTISSKGGSTATKK